MNRQDALSRAAEAFLQTTNAVYDECSTGIARLDRIIVSVHTDLTGWARMLLLPSLYAYWERFFVSALSEYLRAISVVGVACKDSHEALRTLRIRRELLDLGKAIGVSKIHELAERLSPSDIQTLFQDSLRWLDQSLDFPNPERWIDTESNVRFRVLEKNLERLALTVAVVKTHFANGPSLFELLETLVDKRNAIAHGESFSRLSSETWNQLREFVERLLNALQLYLYESLLEESLVFCEANSPSGSATFSMGTYAYQEPPADTGVE
jgi:hypothetical protein